MSTIITPITMPFASGRAAGTLPNVIPAIEPHSSIDNVANQTTGFPVLQATSLGGRGVPVQEGEMNGVLNFYTNLLFQMGKGYQFTFDAALAKQISGYPQGAILWCASNSTFQISLQNNNEKNFVTTPSFVNDGTWWQNLNNAGEFPDITDNATTGSVKIGGRVQNGTQYLTTFDSEGRRAYHQVEVSTGKARAVTWVDNPDGTVNNSTYWEINKRPFCSDLATLAVEPDSQAYIRDCTNVSLTGLLNDGEGSYDFSMEKKRIGQNAFSISITGGIFDVTKQGATPSIRLPLSQVYYNAGGPLSGSTTNSSGVITGSVIVFARQGEINLEFEDIVGLEAGDRYNGNFSILFTGF